MSASTAPEAPERGAGAGTSLEVFTVCPPHAALFGGSGTLDREDYGALLDDHCSWAERLGVSAMLIYEFWQALDPWTVAGQVLARTRTLEPIVAVLPAVSHPAEVARRVASLEYVSGRRVHLNVVAGAKPGDLAALGVPIPGPDRYEHLAEFVDCVLAALAGREHHGPRYHVTTAVPLPVADPPRVVAPGSTADSIATLLPGLDRCLLMGKPLADIEAEVARFAGLGLTGGAAMIVGVVARETDEEARELAERLYSGDRRDALIRRAFQREITSTQHQAVLRLAGSGNHDDCLWFGAGRIGIDCPKLVGSYDRVATAIEAYRRAGVTTLVIDLPHEAAEYGHVGRVLARRAELTDPAPRR